MPLIRLVAIAFFAAVAVALLNGWRGDERSGIAEAIDGDSLRMGGRDIRLAGIDAPEFRQTCRAVSGEIACGRDAHAALAAFLRAGPIKCQIKGIDRYGRDLASCRSGDLDINAALVASGHAVAFGAYVGEERAARAARKGVWATTFQRPAEWRRLHPRESTSR